MITEAMNRIRFQRHDVRNDTDGIARRFTTPQPRGSHFCAAQCGRTISVNKVACKACLDKEIAAQSIAA
jgi:hypothetical protein